MPTGAIQVPPTGQPILLMTDHATTGGYAIAATVITADLSAAGQLAPGDWVEFESCSLERPTRSCGDRRRRLGRLASLFREGCASRFGAERLRADVPLAPFTTFKVGGPAEWLLETRSSDEIVEALAHRARTAVSR